MHPGDSERQVPGAGRNRDGPRADDPAAQYGKVASPRAKAVTDHSVAFTSCSPSDVVGPVGKLLRLRYAE